MALCPSSDIRGHKTSENMLHVNLGCPWVVHSDQLIQIQLLVQPLNLKPNANFLSSSPGQAMRRDHSGISSTLIRCRVVVKEGFQGNVIATGQVRDRWAVVQQDKG